MASNGKHRWDVTTLTEESEPVLCVPLNYDFLRFLPDVEISASLPSLNVGVGTKSCEVAP
jgi:hypothetical protein